MEDQEPCHPLPVLQSPSRAHLGPPEHQDLPSHPKLGSLVASHCPSSDPPSLEAGRIGRGEDRRGPLGGLSPLTPLQKLVGLVTEWREELSV